MARKTFISYKYSDAAIIRDQIIRSLGSDATYYNGERTDSTDMTSFRTETIRKNLSDMIYPTTVMIVVITKNVDLSKWVEWEINYATSRQTRGNRQSQPNGIVMVIEDSLVINGHYTPNRTTRLIEQKSQPVVRSLSGFLREPTSAIEEAYEKSIKY